MEMCSGWLVIGTFFSGRVWAGVRTWMGLELGEGSGRGGDRA